MAKQEHSTTAQELRITLKRSPIGTPSRQRLILRGLGLRRINQTVRRSNTPQVRGMVEKVKHLLEVGTS